MFAPTLLVKVLPKRSCVSEPSVQVGQAALYCSSFTWEAAAFAQVKANVTTELTQGAGREGEGEGGGGGEESVAGLRVGAGSSKQPLKTAPRQRAEESPSRETDGETGEGSRREKIMKVRV